MALHEKGLFDFNTKALLLKQRAPNPPQDFVAGRTKARRLARKHEVVWLTAVAAVITLVAAIIVERLKMVAFRFTR